MLVQIKTLKQLFQRYRRPGNFVFASTFLILSIFLVSQLGNETTWQSATKWSSQPSLWPTISLICMTGFAFLNWISDFVSPRIEGRWQEVTFWLRSFEFIVWFMAYVFIVPVLGYLPSTLLFAVSLTFRMGYRSAKMLTIAALTATIIVVIFKSFLQVKVPGGQVYEFLPDAIRSFMLTYF